MAKKFSISIINEDVNGVIANQEVSPVIMSNQVGDKFYVPEQDMFLVSGTSINARDREGNEILKEDGTNQKRRVGQKIAVVRILDGHPSDVRELFIGQLVKLDVNGRLAYPGPMSTALQSSTNASAKFKEAICGKTLEITEEKEIQDRTWDTSLNAWKRDSEGKFIPSPKVVPHFEIRNTALKAADIEKANEMLKDFYLANYPNMVTVTDEK